MLHVAERTGQLPDFVIRLDLGQGPFEITGGDEVRLLRQPLERLQLLGDHPAGDE